MPSFIKAGPPWFEFLVIFTFLHHGIEKVERHRLWKFHKKIQRKIRSNVPPKLLTCIGSLSCTQKRLSPKVQWRSGDWIKLFYRLDYLYETWHTCLSCSWLQNSASNLLIFTWEISYGLSKSKKRGKTITKLWKIIRSSATDEAPGRNVFSICPLLFFLVLYSPFCLSSCLLKKYHVFTNNKDHN